MHRKLRLAKTTVQSTDNQIGRDRGICRCRFCETLPAAPEYWPFAKQQKGAGGAGQDRSMPIQAQPWPELRCTFPEAFYIQPYTNRVPKKVGLVEHQLWQILLLTVRNPLALLLIHSFESDDQICININQRYENNRHLAYDFLQEFLAPQVLL